MLSDSDINCLSRLLKKLIRGLGHCGLGGYGLGGGAGLPGTVAAPGSGGGLRLQTFNGEVDFACGVDGDYHHLHILPLGQVLPDIADIGIGHFGNMYHACAVLRQRDECAEVGDAFDLASMIAPTVRSIL